MKNPNKKATSAGKRSSWAIYGGEGSPLALVKAKTKTGALAKFYSALDIEENAEIYAEKIAAEKENLILFHTVSYLAELGD